jgi:hypothetical protein
MADRACQQSGPQASTATGFLITVNEPSSVTNADSTVASAASISTASDTRYTEAFSG